MVKSSPPPTARLSIDNGEWLTVVSAEATSRPVYVRSEGAVLPDPKWSYVDTQGHFHAWSPPIGRTTGDLPSLRSREVREPCDGSCGGACRGEGSFVIVRTCLLCGEEVTPAYVPDHLARTRGFEVQGPAPEWLIRVEHSEPLRAPRGTVSLRYDERGQERFGFGDVGAWSIALDGPTKLDITATLWPRLG